MDSYYNNFYSKIAKIDAKYNGFNKIKTYLPNLSPGDKILDVGCGYGTTSENLLKMGINVYGMELNTDALKSLKQKGFYAIKHDITKTFPFKGNLFDGVLLLDILEHVFDPLFLLMEAKRVLKKEGFIIIRLPLYFDLIDRLRILFTGKIVSYDNLCYGKEIYSQYRSYNYDHIRFFRPDEIDELINIIGLKIDIKDYTPLLGIYFNKFIGLTTRIIANKQMVNRFPNLLAHAVFIRAIK